MRLAQDGGGEVTGTYGSSGGRVLGRATAGRFSGHWIGPGQTCSTELEGSRTWGNYQITLREDGQHFSGQWSYCDAPVSGTWDADRVGGTTPAASSAAASPTAPAGADTSAGPIPAAYRGEWAHSAMTCTSAKWTITANSVRDWSGDLYNVTSVEPRAGGIFVRGVQPSGQIDTTFTFAMSADGGLVYTDHNGIAETEMRCPAATR